MGGKRRAAAKRFRSLCRKGDAMDYSGGTTEWRAPAVKIGIVGCGMVGPPSASPLIMSGGGGERVLVDVTRARGEAEANALFHAVPFAPPLVVRAGDYQALEGAGVVVIAGGVAQKPGETRLQ